MKALGQRLQELRRQKDLSVSDCARYLEVSVSTYREWENGRTIKGEPYVLMAELFEVSLGELLTGRASDLAKGLSELEKRIHETQRYVKSLRALL